MTPPHPDRSRRTALVRLTTLAACLGALVALTVPLFVAQAGAQRAETGWARFGHFAPAVAAVDIQVDGEPFASGIGFRSTSDYASLDAGPHLFELRPAGEPDAEPLLSIEANVPAGGAVTIGAVSTLDGVAPQVYRDALQTPAAGEALVRFIHSAPDVSSVDVQIVDGPLLASAVPYPEANDYQAIRPGVYRVEILDAGTDRVLLQVDGWEIEPGTQASIVIVRGLDGRIDVAPVLDTVATASAPVGGVESGFGGMAGVEPGGTRDFAGAPLLAVAAAGVGSLVVGRRLHRRWLR